MGEPPLFGATHDIVTISASKEVVGAAGRSGIYAARILTTVVFSLKPYALRAST